MQLLEDELLLTAEEATEAAAELRPMPPLDDCQWFVELALLPPVLEELPQSAEELIGGKTPQPELAASESSPPPSRPMVSSTG